MPRRKATPRVDIRDQKATVIVLDARLSANGGKLDDDVVVVWQAIKAALMQSAHGRGLAFTWTAELKCVNQKVMAARIERDELCIELPPAVDAVAKGGDVL